MISLVEVTNLVYQDLKLILYLIQIIVIIQLNRLVQEFYHYYYPRNLAGLLRNSYDVRNSIVNYSSGI